MNRLRLRPGRRPEDFYRWTGPRPFIEFDGLKVRAPLFYHRAEGFQSLHLASYDAVRKILPCDDLHPIRWFDGRALVGIGAFRYEHVSTERADGTRQMLAPYGEVGVTALASRRSPRVKGLGMLKGALASGLEGFILDLPVTTAEARDAGREGYGMAKFVADMDFTEEPGHRRVVLSEEETHIFTLEVRASGPVLPDRAPMTTYSVHDGQLIETVIRCQGHSQTSLGPRGGRLTLGQHPVAERLRTLDVAADPLVVESYLARRLILPAGTPVGPARDYQGHVGLDRERGRLTVSYPGTDPIDLYTVPSGLPRSARSSAPGTEVLTHA